MIFRQTEGLAIAAAKAAISTYRHGHDHRLPSSRKKPRDRRRPYPLVDVFDADVVPMLTAAPSLRSVAIFKKMQRCQPDQSAGARRTLQRRIRSWRALHRADQEVIFREVHQPGRMGLSDFTDVGDLGVTIAGASLDRRPIIFAWPTPASSMRTASSAMKAMSPWLKGCKTRFEASAERRSNTAATASRLHSATWQDARTDLTRRYDALCARYGMQPTRNNCGVAHENGVIESARGHLRAAVVDALLMRGTRDFDDLASYRRFVDEIVSRKNAHHAKRIEAERSALQRLPGQRTCDFEETVVTVTSSGGFTLRKVFYTVPSRLIGHRLRACLLDKLPERSACRMMVDLVVLAHERCCEAALATALEADLSAAQLPDIATLRPCFAPDPAALPEVIVHLMPLIAY